MDVILLQKVQNLGGLGEIVSVKPGFARNFLIPRGKAVTATSANRAACEARRAELERAAAQTLASAQARREVLNAKIVTIPMRAGDGGKLFGSVGTQDIADALTNAGAAVEKSEVRLPNGAFRHTGEYEVTIHLHPDVDAQIKVIVAAE